jgi:uncharacterized repeat protein (TIGR03943 family)
MVREAFGALGAAVLGLAIVLRLADGSAGALVQAWYFPVLLASAVVLLGLATVAAVRALRSGWRWDMRAGRWSAVTAGLVALPAVLGLLFQPQPLGSATLNRDAGMGATRQFSMSAGTADPTQRNLYQWAYEFATAPPSALIGSPVDIIAFVYHGREEPQQGMFLAARFVVACCVADAAGFTLPVQWRGAAELRSDEWVRVTGRVAAGPDGALVIHAESVESISAPSNPYIYP